jgi:hypothetical protein
VSLLALCERVGRSAREAARRRESSFAVPEWSAAADWVGAKADEPGLRDDAAAWLKSGATYHELVRLCARAVVGLDARWPPSKNRYRDKAEGELEPMLALWPDVLVWPTASPLSPLDLVDLRAFPVHPLGLAGRPTWTDGALDSPSEFFFHDLDHARFKIREDLLVEGIAIPDAYRDGSTLDPENGRHRVILSHVVGRIGDRLWERAPERCALAQQLRTRVAALEASPYRSATELLLFEIVHEKSFPLDPAVLDRELAGESHLAKLRLKAANRFFPGGTDDAVVAALPRARSFLREILA